MSRVDRSRMVELRAALDLQDRLGPDQTQRMLVQVYDGGSIPTTVPKVYLTHPTLTDADDIEGATPSYTTDSALTIPVVVLGPTVPVAGDHLIAHAIAGRWLAGDGGGSPTPTCSPCDLPTGHNLKISFTQTPSGPSGGPWTFTYYPGPPDYWFIACDEIFYSFDALIGCGSSHLVVFSPRYFETGDCLGDIPFDFVVTLIDYTCDPLHLHYRAPIPDNPGFYANWYIDYP